MANSIPQTEYALIGGSGTWGARFPEDLDLPNVKLVEVYDGFDTPFGRTIAFKLLEIAGALVWRVAMHGIHFNAERAASAPPWVATKQVGWVLQQAGVQRALVEGSVGGIQDPNEPGAPLPPWSVVITSDFTLGFRPGDDQPFVTGRKQTPRLRHPFCDDLRGALLRAAQAEPKFAVVRDHGVYVTSQPGRFETAAEIRGFALLGGHLVGHTLGHEALLLRRLGIHLGSLNIVSNHAEGIADWSGAASGSMADFYFECPRYVGPVMVAALTELIQRGPEPCRCPEYQLAGLANFPVDGA
jgi:5'-methylthioadenosine phosphorylase